MGSSSRRMGVSWASSMATHTRWRWPPESSSTNRVARSDTPVEAIAAVTAVSSARLHWRSGLWCGCRPRATRSSTRIPSGVTAPCGRSPIRRATALVRSRCRSCPSSRIRPSPGAITRARALSSVDLPQALGPTITVNASSGSSRSRSVATTRRSYASRAPSTVSPRPRSSWAPARASRSREVGRISPGSPGRRRGSRRRPGRRCRPSRSRPRPRRSGRTSRRAGRPRARSRSPWSSPTGRRRGW